MSAAIKDDDHVDGILRLQLSADEPQAGLTDRLGRTVARMRADFCRAPIIARSEKSDTMTAASVAPGAPITSLIPELDALAAAAMADWKVPGAALAVVQDGKVALLEGLWPARRRSQSAGHDRYAIPDLLDHQVVHRDRGGAAAQRRASRLDKTGARLLPEFRLHDAVATERVTVLDLLCHQSGLPRHDWVHMPGDRSPAEMLPLMRHLEPSRDIRAAWQYNNLGYNVLGLLIERVSGQSYESFIRTRLTDRLGMKVSFTLDELKPRRSGGAVHDARGHAAARHAPADPHHRGRCDQHVGRRTSPTGCGCTSARASSTASGCCRPA